MDAILQKRGFRKSRGIRPPALEKYQNLIKANGYQVTVTHPEKVLYPQARFTKTQIIEYPALREDKAPREVVKEMPK